MNNLKPLKHFGQNFIFDTNLINKILKCLKVTPSDYVVEIGPGLGALTKPIALTGCKYIAFDIDKRMVDHLTGEQINAKLQDFLTWDFKVFEKNKIRIVGNLPYNITSPIIFHTINNLTKVQDCTFMMQYEVAKRITASPGSKDYGRLSVMCQYYFDVEFLFKVPPSVFVPVPKVDSAMLKLIPKPTIKANPKLFATVVKKAFANRRKTLNNTLSEYKQALEQAKINPALRAENLSLDDFINITKHIK